MEEERGASLRLLY